MREVDDVVGRGGCGFSGGGAARSSWSMRFALRTASRLAHFAFFLAMRSISCCSSSISWATGWAAGVGGPRVIGKGVGNGVGRVVGRVLGGGFWVVGKGVGAGEDLKIASPRRSQVFFSWEMGWLGGLVVVVVEIGVVLLVVVGEVYRIGVVVAVGVL